MSEIRARVIAQEKGLYRIANDQGEERSAEVSGKFRYGVQTVSDFPAVGDYVVATWPDDGSHAVISMVFPRKSCFIRKAAGTGKQEQVVAANVDTVFVCMSLNRDFQVRRLERYMAAAWDSSCEPVVVLTKKDLCEDIERYLAMTQAAAPGVEILTISSLDDSVGIIENRMEKGKTYALIGSSGVGKSTIINRLRGNNDIRTDGLRNDDKGHHTTTHRELICMQNGAFIIDTPGMRELGMWDHEEGIESAFAEITELTRGCRFPDCHHGNEPGCAVQAAIQNGELSEERWNSYLKLQRENACAADESAYLKAKEAKFKEIAKINKRNRR